MNYSGLNLDNQLVALDSPLNEVSNNFNGYNIDALFERNAITLAKIRSFSFNAGTGGTLVLGGQGNGNGILRVEDTDGNQKILLNNEGIRVDDGNITIYNAGGTLAFDSNGLVSNANFGSVLTTTSVSTNVSGTSPAIISESGTMVVARENTFVLFLISARMYLVETPPTDTCLGVVNFYINGTQQDGAGIQIDSGNVHGFIQSTHLVSVLNAGTYTYNLRGNISIFGGSPHMTVANSQISALRLGT